MTCMCGDLYCLSCGPAQGNSKCIICGKWTDEGGCEDPKACEHAMKMMNRAEADQLAEVERIAEEGDRRNDQYAERDTHQDD